MASKILTRPDQTTYDSSFFHVSYSGKRVLVLAPHQDDEINIAANAIQIFAQQGAEVFVVFSTNGDYELPADIRLTEAANSLQVLGVPRENIFIMGYADSLNDFSGGHVFSAPEDSPVTAPNGHSHTYGAAGFQDFSYLTRHEHSRYCRNDYLRDLEELILYIHADIILSVDFDVHIDHRMLSLSFEEVMGKILSRPGNDYTPEVFKRFAYSTAFLAPRNFFADNLPATQKPVSGRYGKDIIDTSCYSWEQRVRMPMSENCRKPILTGNTIAQALKQHKSQKAILQAERIIKSDEVFFRRRTDSLTFSAQVKASSGNPGYAHDFMLMNAAEISSISQTLPEWTNYLWRPADDDKDKTLVFSWPDEQKISRIVLWGNIDGTPVQKILLRMDNGYSQKIGPLPEKGLPSVTDIPEAMQCGVRELSIAILDAGGSEGGIAEAEAFSSPEQQGGVMPFVQISSQDNFVYTYNRRPDELSVPVEFYCFKTQEPARCEVSGNARLDDGKLVFLDNGDVVLKAYSGEAYCRSVFHVLTGTERTALHSQQLREKIYLRCKHFWKGAVKYSKMMFEQGVSTAFKRACNKIMAVIKGED